MYPGPGHHDLRTVDFGTLPGLGFWFGAYSTLSLRSGQMRGFRALGFTVPRLWEIEVY